MGDTPGADSRIDYLMLRMPKLTEELSEDLDDPDESPGLNSALTSALSRSSISNFSNRMMSMKQIDRRASTKLRSSVKVNLRSTETSLKLKNLALINRQRTKIKVEEQKGGFDMEENKQRQELMRVMSVSRTED